MLSAVEELKIRSKILLKQRHTADSPLVSLAKDKSPQLKHALLYVAREAGFKDWQHAQSVLSCQHKQTMQQDSGKFWYSPACMALLNHWCANYPEALALQAKQGGVILPYKSQYVVAKASYIEALGLSPKDPLWEPLEYNWCEGSSALRQELAYKRLLAMQTLRYKAC
ncbi:hypothetical protein [Agarivorans albus]|uniref:Uncharacterized protein n=1 Tax=Agarivorans albus MKT 106 TaxID=1331007 RepID=R9PHK2_AGAAL|nr:hypothetical protein [Agarivorans albus]GAD00854.1 hypothetical protein AALB_0934 [Agarivorans albus MKT 106]